MASVYKSLSDEGSLTGVGNVWTISLGEVVKHRSNSIRGKIWIPRGHSSDPICRKCCNGVTFLWSVYRCWQALLSKEERKFAMTEDNDDDYSSEEEAQNADNNQMVRLDAGLCLCKIHVRVEVMKLLIEVEKFGLRERLVSWKLSVILDDIQREMIPMKTLPTVDIIMTAGTTFTNYFLSASSRARLTALAFFQVWDVGCFEPIQA